MKQFELRFLDRLDVVVCVRAYACADDFAALSEAERKSITHTIEIWDGDRRVARVKKGYVPPLTTDRLGG